MTKVTAEDDAALEMRSIEHRISEAIAESSSNSIEGDELKRQRWDLNSKFQMENFIRRQNDLLLLSRRKSVRVTTRRPHKNSVIISTHKNKYNNDKLVINMPWKGKTGVDTNAIHFVVTSPPSVVTRPPLLLAPRLLLPLSILV